MTTMSRGVVLVLAVALGAAGAANAEESGPDTTRPVQEFQVLARNWSFAPDRIEVRAGTHVVLHVKSMDSPHSFVMKSHRLKVPLPQDETTIVEFDADEPGTYKFRCGRPCGNGCPKMRGTVVVLEALPEG